MSMWFNGVQIFFEINIYHKEEIEKMYIPFPYQCECLDAVQEVRDQGLSRALAVMASGLGKTVTMAFDAKRWREQRGKGRVLFLCHNNDILYQAKSTFQIVNGADCSYGYFHGEEKHLHHVDFLFASFQTMEIHRDLFGSKEFDYIVVDESHHSQADTFRSTLEYFQPQFLLGMTATPDRLDKLDIREVFGKEVFYLPLEEAMARGLVTPVDYRLMTDEIQLSEGLSTEEGRMSIAKLNRRIFIPRRDEEIAGIISRHASEIENPRTIIFCASIKHCEHLAQFVPNSFAIHSKVPQSERTVKLEMFRQGTISTVLVVDAFNEGIDVPQANIVVFLRSTVSRTIFLQQLGRGLRKSEGKDKVLALDFVANCERIEMIHAMWRQIEEALGANSSEGVEIASPMTLNVDSVEFTETILPLLNLIERIRPNFCPTWQEASIVAIELGIKSGREYSVKQREDSRLPSRPSQYYQDFPGWNEFLGKESPGPKYETCEEASRATFALEIKGKVDYEERYKEDPMLPSNPRQYYQDFPGWYQFTRRTYGSWQEASKAAIALGITTISGYQKHRKADRRLPGDPRNFYENFPSWTVFLNHTTKEFYEIWQEASKAAIALNIKSSVVYKDGAYKRNAKLPSMPENTYEDFPGWEVFLGKESVVEKYKTWQEASRAALRLGIASSTMYLRNLCYKADPRLPSSPARQYDDFPGWKRFLQKT